MNIGPKLADLVEFLLRGNLGHAPYCALEEFQLPPITLDGQASTRIACAAAVAAWVRARGSQGGCARTPAKRRAARRNWNKAMSAIAKSRKP